MGALWDGSVVGWERGGMGALLDGSIVAMLMGELSRGMVVEWWFDQNKERKTLSKITALCITCIPTRQEVGANYHEYLSKYLI